jgi:Icc protein
MQNFSLGWASDLHFDFAHETRRAEFVESIKRRKLDALLVTGDIATSRRFSGALTLLESLGLPVYFCSGNHDFYASSFARVDAELGMMCQRSPNLTRLGDGEIIDLGCRTVLVGHGGWGDGRAGLGAATSFKSNDSWLIKELAKLPVDQLFEKLRALGEASAHYFCRILPKALEQADHVLVTTHVPPYVEACRHGGQPCSDEHLPYYCNVVLGKTLRSIASIHRDKRITVLCGHTHEACCYEAAPNLSVQVAGAQPGHPRIEAVLEFSVNNPGGLFISAAA